MSSRAMDSTRPDSPQTRHRKANAAAPHGTLKAGFERASHMDHMHACMAWTLSAGPEPVLVFSTAPGSDKLRADIIHGVVSVVSVSVRQRSAYKPQSGGERVGAVTLHSTLDITPAYTTCSQATQRIASHTGGRHRQSMTEAARLVLVIWARPQYAPIRARLWHPLGRHSPLHMSATQNWSIVALSLV